MARKLSDLTQATTLSADDLFYLVNNPSGTKDDRSLSAATLFAGVTGNLAAAGPDPWFDVTNPAYGALNDGTNPSHVTTNGINAAIAAANAVSHVFARGAIVWFPPGTYSIDSTLTTPGPGVTLLGAISQGIGTGAMASTIKNTNTGSPIFDLGNDATSDVTIMWLDFEGTNATNLLQRGIIAASMHGLIVEHCSFDQLGGQAIKIDAGGDITIRWCLFENCIKYYVNQSGDPPTSYVGVIQSGADENIVEYNNVNGTAGIIAGGAGTGFMCGGYFSFVETTLRFNTFAFCERGVRIDAGFLNVVVNNRFEYNQREGLVSLGYESVYIGNRFGNNSMSAMAGAVDCQIGDAGSNGYGNVFCDNVGFFIDLGSAGYSVNRPSYNFFLNGGGGADSNHHNEVYNNRGTNATIGTYVVAGTAPNSISQNLIEVTGGGGPTATFNPVPQQGVFWTLNMTTALSGAATLTINAPQLPLKNMVVYIKIANNTGGALTTHFDTVFKSVGYTDPAAGMFKTGIYRYDGTNWLQQGAWSADMS